MDADMLQFCCFVHIVIDKFLQCRKPAMHAKTEFKRYETKASPSGV